MINRIPEEEYTRDYFLIPLEVVKIGSLIVKISTSLKRSFLYISKGVWYLIERIRVHCPHVPVPECTLRLVTLKPVQSHSDAIGNADARVKKTRQELNGRQFDFCTLAFVIAVTITSLV